MSTRTWEYGHQRLCFLVEDNGVLLADGESASGAGCSGMTKVTTIGLFSRRAAHCSLYQSHQAIWLQIDQQRFCLSEDAFTIEYRGLAGPFIRRFAVVNGESKQPEIEFYYWFFALIRDPWPDSGDFFEYVARSTQDRQSRAEFICFWQARARSRGHVTEEEVAAVQECVRELVSNR
jgi:hypothetical protein